MATDTDPTDPATTARALTALSTRVSDLARSITTAIADLERLANQHPDHAAALRETAKQLDGLYRYRKQLLARRALLLAERTAGAAAQRPEPTDRPQPPQSPKVGCDPQTMPDSLGNPPIVHRPYPGMPDRADWLENPRPGLRNGANGFELALIRDLAAVGIRTYSSSLLNKLRPLPAAIPIYLDWLENLDQRIPGPEHRGPAGTPPPHKLAIHTDLIRNIDDRSARGNLRAIAILTDQIRHGDLDELQRYSAAKALATITTADHYDLIAELIAERPHPDEVTAALLTYFGRFKNTRALNILIPHLDHPDTLNYAIEALGRIKADGTRELIEPFLTSPDDYTRKLARRVIKKLN